MLTKDQFRVLDSLAAVKLHNSNRKNLKIRFQPTRHDPDDVQKMINAGFMKLNLAQEYYLTESGVSEIKKRY